MADPNSEFLKQRYGGAATDPNAAFLQSMFGGSPPITPAGPKRVNDIGDAILAGLQNSATGLAVRGQMPDQEVGPNAPWYHRIAAGAAGMIADMPLSVAAAIPAAPGGPIGMGAAAFAAPMALREGLIEAYSNGHAASWEGVWEIAKAALTGGAKGAVIGGATMGAGKFVAGALPATATTTGAVAKGSAVVGAEVATLTATASALEGHMPTWQDFMDNAILLGGMKGAVKIAGGLRNIYAETGKTPVEVVADATRDPQLKAELLGEPTPQTFAEIFAAQKEQKKQIAAQLSGKTYEEVTAAHEHAVKLNLELEVQAVGKFLGAEKQQEFVALSGKRRAQDKWLENNITDEAQSWLNQRQLPEDFIGSFRKAVNDFDSESPSALGRSIAILAKDIDAPDFFYTPEGMTVRNALIYAKEQGWSMDAVLGGMRERAVEWAGRDAPELFERMFSEAKRNPGPVVLPEPPRDALPPPISKAAQELPEAYRTLALNERINAAIDADKRPELAAELTRQATNPDSPVLKDPVRYEYITDKATAEGVVRAVAEVYRDGVEAQRRGTVPTEQSLADGVRLIQEGKLEARTIGEGANSAEIAARALLTKGAAERARKMADEMPTDPLQWTPEMKLKMAGAMEQVGLFYRELAGAGAEAGRALQMLRQIKRNPDMMGDAETLVKLYERKGNFTDIADIVKTLKDPEQMRVFAEQYQKATGLDMVIEGWKAAILSGIHTTGANVIGNFLRFGAEIPSAMLTATIQAGKQAAKGEPMSMALYKAKALSPIYGVMLGAKDAVMVAGEVWRQKGEHVEKADVYKTAIPGKTGEIVRLPFRFLQLQDAFFRTFGERAKAYELAVERAGKEGLDPRTREFNEAVSRYTKEPQLGLSESAAQNITKVIQEAGAEWIFAQRLGPRFEGVSRAIQGSPAEFIFPFRRTPVNLISWAVQYTPGLNFMSARWRNDFAAGGEAKAKAIARVAIGTGLAMTAFSLAEQGILTGGGLFDKEMSGTKRGAGWQPYSLNINGKYYNIERLEPLAKPLMLAADLFELQQVATDKEDKAKIGAMAVLAFGNATISTTYMSGMANAMKATLEPDRYLDSFIEQYASSLVPKIVGQTVTMFDPYQREVDGALDAIQSQLPFIREKLLPARNVWGEPKQNNKWFDVLPIATSQAATEKVKTEAVRLQVAIKDAPKDVIERGPFKPGEKKIELTGEQRDLMRQISGKGAMEILRPIVNSPDWGQIPDFAKAKIYQEVIKDQRRLAAFTALPPDAPERDAVRRKILDKIVEQTDAVSGGGLSAADESAAPLPAFEFEKPTPPRRVKVFP